MFRLPTIVAAMPPPPAGSRRLSQRKSLRAPATVTLREQEREVQLWDLGVGGASLMATRPIAQGSNLVLRFDLPDNGDRLALEVAGKVVHSTYLAPAEFKIGLVFPQLDADVVAAIDAYLERD